MGARRTKSAANGWVILYWCALSLVWLLYLIQTLLCQINDFKNPYPATSFLITALLTFVVIPYRWAIARMAAFGGDIEELLKSSDATTSRVNGKKWYATEFEEIFKWTRSVALAAFFTLVAAIIAVRIEIANWFPT